MKSTTKNIVTEIMRLIANSLTMSPTGYEIYSYKWWNMAMAVEKVWGLDIDLFLRCGGLCWKGELRTKRRGFFSSPKASLYRGTFTKVVLFDLAMLAYALTLGLKPF